MSLRINTNIDALTAYRNLSNTQASMSTSLERLSSGLRINKAADDAAGLAISQGLTAQINGIGQAVRNAQDGINVVQTADGALTETQSILQRMRTLSVQAANDSNDSNSRTDMQTEVDQLNKELDRIAGATSFNGVSLLDGTFKGKVFQVGANNVAANDQIGVDITAAGTANAVAKWDNGAASYTAGTTPDALTFTYGTTVAKVNLSSSGDGSGTTTTSALSGSTSNAQDVAAALNGNADFASKFAASVSDKGGLVVTALKPSSTASDTITVANGAAAGSSLSTATSSVATQAADGGFTSSDLGVSAIKLDSAANAGAAIDTLDKAITAVSTARANLGALQNRFQHTINNLNVTQQNLQASNSSITDTDMASEMSNFTRAQILSQAGTSMLKQANQASQSVLSLLQ